MNTVMYQISVQEYSKRGAGSASKTSFTASASEIFHGDADVWPDHAFRPGLEHTSKCELDHECSCKGMRLGATNQLS